MSDHVNIITRYDANLDSHRFYDGRKFLGVIAVEDLEEHCPEWKKEDQDFGVLLDEVKRFWAQENASQLSTAKAESPVRKALRDLEQWAEKLTEGDAYRHAGRYMLKPRGAGVWDVIAEIRRRDQRESDPL